LRRARYESTSEREKGGERVNERKGGSGRAGRVASSIRWVSFSFPSRFISSHLISSYISTSYTHTPSRTTISHEHTLSFSRFILHYFSFLVSLFPSLYLLSLFSFEISCFRLPVIRFLSFLNSSLYSWSTSLPTFAALTFERYDFSEF